MDAQSAVVINRLDSREDVLMVTRGPFMQSGATGFAYVVEDGVAIKSPIVAGMTSVGRVEILSGLREGQQIVISSSDVFGRHDRVLLTNLVTADQ
jgi:HlyD family secretion protein